MAIRGTEPAEKLARSISVPGLNGVGKLVSNVNAGGLVPQSKLDVVADMTVSSIDSMPCMGVLI
jgi:hypothetical protein